MAEELPIHPFTGLTALGVLPSGRIVWPVIGAAPEDGDGDGGTGDGGDGSGTGDGGAGDGSGGQGGDGLGDAGKKALEAERRARREAERARKSAEDELARLKAGAGDGGNSNGDGKANAEQIRREAEQAATKRANERILRSEIRAAAAGKLTDPADALAHLNLADFEVKDDGSIDEQHITDAISDLIKRKPYLAAKAPGFQGTGDGGAAGRDSGPKQLTRADLKNMNPGQIEKARQEGRLTKVLGG